MKSTRILVVEDEQIVAEDLKMTLEGLGYIVAGIASSGEKAIELAGTEKPDLILMDIMLAGKMDGIEAAEKIQARMNVPLIYLTAYSDDATLERAKRTKPYSYLIKPFEERELYSNIEMALYKHKVHHSATDSAPRIHEMLGGVFNAVAATNLKGRVLYLNPPAEQMTGYSSSEAVGQPITDLLQLRSVDQGNPFDLPFPESGEKTGMIGIPMEISLMTKNGEVVPVHASMALIREPGGENGGFLLVFRDIRPHQARDQKVRDQVMFFRKMIDQLDVAVGCVGKNLHLVYTNPAFIGITAGWTASADLTSEPLPAVFPLVSSFSSSAIQSVFRTGKSESQVEEVRDGQSSRKVQVQRIPLRVASGVSGVMLVVRPL